MSFRQKDHWGTYLWGFIHTISIVDMEHNLDYNKSALAQLKGLVNSIPCEKCKMHYKQDLEILDTLDLNQKMVLFYWSVDLHNKINKKLNKMEWTYKMALEKWTRTL